ncbi:MAG: glutaminyl-peptide cyclotransferase [Bacteroidota bacterium]
MTSIKGFVLVGMSMFLIACGKSNDDQKLTINTNSAKDVFSIDDTIELSINNPENIEIGSIKFSLNGKKITKSHDLKNEKLGQLEITAKIKTEDSEEVIKKNITILNNQKPDLYTYKVLNEYPHDITSYTQGLEFRGADLYESTGQYKESKLRKINYETGEILKNVNLDDQYFAEGLTILDNKIYQLTWKENTGFVYDLETFQKESSFTYGKSKEGWGLCNDAQVIYKSDGTENIWLLNPETLAENSKIQVYTNKGKIVGINEMEYINGKIYANRYQKNGVAIINPNNGAVEGVIDFSPLRKMVKQHDGLDVLNGIAYNPVTKTIFVTGKRWDKLFEVEITKK